MTKSCIITEAGSSTSVDQVNVPSGAAEWTRRNGGNGEAPKKTISPVTGSILGCAVMGPSRAPPKSYSPMVPRSAAISVGAHASSSARIRPA